MREVTLTLKAILPKSSIFWKRGRSVCQRIGKTRLIIPSHHRSAFYLFSFLGEASFSGRKPCEGTTFLAQKSCNWRMVTVTHLQFPRRGNNICKRKKKEKLGYGLNKKLFRKTLALQKYPKLRWRCNYLCLKNLIFDLLKDSIH